jgi:DNA ligase-1
VRLLQDGDNEEAKYIVRWLQKNLKTGAAEKTMISALARAVVYSQPNTILTKKPVVNSKKDKGEDWFLEECARVEFAIKEAACEFPNYGAIVNSLLIHGTDTQALAKNCHMRVGIPLKPMLAKPTKGVQIILKRFEGIDFTCEYKYDGFRGQIHFWREKEPVVRIYSRNLENMTVAYPDVTEFLAEHVPETVQNFIIDAELVAYDPVNKKILPF